MIYLASGLPVTNVISGNIEKNVCTVKAYGGEQHGIETYDRPISDLRADEGINEVHFAIKNPDLYEPQEKDYKEYFNKYCK